MTQNDSHPIIPFNRAHSVGTEAKHIVRAIENGHLSADGPYSQRCREWLESTTGAHAALLVHSCTAALELAVQLAGVGPGDEVIVPSFTFTSTANAVVVHGATPVFIDVRQDTLNLDETQVSACVTSRTKAIMPVHYAGVSANMDAINKQAEEFGLTVIEDAAQGLMANFNDKPLGTLAPLGALSFHETKNITCGEGGALLINDSKYLERAEILREKGTNRSRFFRGEVDKYTWVDRGSSYAMSDLTASFLWSQMEHATSITERRREIWETYHRAFVGAEQEGALRRPIIPDTCTHNAHMYYILMPTAESQRSMLKGLNARGIRAVFHYVPLHSSPAGQAHGRSSRDLKVTDDVSSRLVRLPLFPDLQEVEIERVISAVHEIAGIDRSQVDLEETVGVI